MTGYSSINTEFIDQNPKGIWRLTPYMNPMVIMVIPREYIRHALTLANHEYSRGVYFLVDDTHTSIYIGQTVQGIARLQDHDKKKSFWTTAIMFLNLDQIFTLDLISGLERYAIEQSMEEGLYNVLNKQTPNYQSGQTEFNAVKAIYEDIKFVMAYLGHDLVEAPGEDSGASNEAGKDETKKDEAEMPVTPASGTEAEDDPTIPPSSNKTIVYYDLSVPVKTGTKPAAIVIGGTETSVKTWKDILVTMAKHIGQERLIDFAKEEEEKKHPLIATDNSKLRAAQEVSTGLWLETNLSAQSIINQCRRLEQYFNITGSKYGMYELDT